MRRLAKWLAIGFGGLLLVFFAATKIVHTAWNGERAGRSISRWASKSLAGRGGPTGEAFTFGSVDYPWFGAVRSLLGGAPVRFDARDIHIWDPSGKEILHANRVQAGLRLNRLVGARIRSFLPFGQPDLELHFVDAVVDELRCQLELERDGVVNLVAAFAAGENHSKRSGGGMVISVSGSVVRDGRFRMRFPKWSAEIEHFKMQHDSLRYSSFQSERRDDSPAFTYRVSRVEAPLGKLVIGDYSFPLDHVVATDFHAEEPRRQDMVIKGTAQSLGSMVAVAGRLTNLYTARRESHIFLDAKHGARVLASLPSRAMLGGDVSANAHINGPFDGTIIEGEARGAELHVVGLDVRNVDARYRLGHDALHLDRVTSDVAGGHATGGATLDWKTRAWSADLELDGIRTLQLGKLAPLEMLVYLAGIPIVILHAGKSDTDSVEHLHIKGIDLELRRRPHSLVPHHLMLRGAFK